MTDTPTAEQRAAEAARKWLEQREWVEDCTCADDPEGQCWYHLTARQKGESRIKSATDAFANFAEDLLAALSTVEAERDRLRERLSRLT